MDPFSSLQSAVINGRMLSRVKPAASYSKRPRICGMCCEPAASP